MKSSEALPEDVQVVENILHVKQASHIQDLAPDLIQDLKKKFSPKVLTKSCQQKIVKLDSHIQVFAPDLAQDLKKKLKSKGLVKFPPTKNCYIIF